jgi:hypothetical protein
MEGEIARQTSCVGIEGRLLGIARRLLGIRELDGRETARKAEGVEE